MDPRRKYIEAKVRTASPVELMIMLFDGAIGFSEQAKIKFAKKDFEGSCELLIRSQRILLELIGALNPQELGKDTYEKLCGHYWFVHGRLVQANLDHEARWIDEALFVLASIRDRWANAVASGEEKALAVTVPTLPDRVEVEERAVSLLNLQG